MYKFVVNLINTTATFFLTRINFYVSVISEDFLVTEIGQSIQEWSK